MRSKAPLALMEQLVMVLVFALAAALCVQAFALSGRLSQQDERRDHALLAAQNAAETLKSTHGDYARAAQEFGGAWDGAQWVCALDETGAPTGGAQSAYLLLVVPEDSGSAFLGRAAITVCDADGGTLAALPIAWQTAKEAAHE